MPDNNSTIGPLRRALSNAYLVSVVCTGLQFLQLHRASAFFRDDLNFMVSLDSIIEQVGLRSNFMYYYTYKSFVWLDDPFLIKLFILAVVMLGVISFLYITSLMGISLVLSLIALTLAMTLWFNAEPVFFISAFSASFSWSTALISMALFLVSFRSTNTAVRLVSFLASVFLYWIAVTIYAQQAFAPFVTVLIALLFLYRGRSVMGGDTGAPLKKATLIGQSGLYLLLTSAAFIIRKYVFAIEYHYYKAGLIDHSIGNIVKNIKIFLQQFYKSLVLHTFAAPMLPPADFYIAAAVTLVLVAFFLYYKGAEIKEQGTKDLIIGGGVLLIYSALTLMPITIIKITANRYHFTPSIFLVAGGLFLLCALVVHLTKRSGRSVRNWTYLIAVVLLAALFLIVSFNRFTHIEDYYVSKADLTRDFAAHLEPVMKEIPKNGQLVVIDHPIHVLTIGYNHWSTGLLRLTTGRKDINGIVTRGDWKSDLFSEQITEKRNGRFFRKKVVNMKRDRPLAIYVFEDGGFRRRDYMTIREGANLKLFSLERRREPPRLLFSASAGDEGLMAEYESIKKIADSDIWRFKPYPPNHFD